MAAAALHLELQQQIFSLLDSKSFHAARSTCRWWRYASLSHITLVEQLQKLPVWPPVEKKRTAHNDLLVLFNQAAHRLMFSLKVIQEQKLCTGIPSAWKLPVRPKMAKSSDGTKLATLNGRNVTLFDVSEPSPRAEIQRQLHDLRDIPVGCPGLRASASSHHEIALSSDGRILAVARDRTIQVYALFESDDSKAVTRFIADGCDRRVTSLDFEQDDYMLRVQLSGDGAVLYLGSPAHNETAKATIDHWRGNGGLKHTFLDSSRLTLASGNGPKTRFSGLQLLQPSHRGYIFAAQRHSAAESSRYLLGHVKSCPNPYTITQAAEHASVTELAALQSFMGSRDYTMTELSHLGMGGWETMPSAHELHPRFGVSGDLLVVAERDKKSVRSGSTWTQLFLYRVPSERQISAMLEEVDSLKDESIEAFVEAWSDRRVVNEVKAAEKIQHDVARIPICLGGMVGEVTDIKFTKAVFGGQQSKKLEVMTGETTKVWSLVDSH